MNPIEPQKSLMAITAGQIRDAIIQGEIPLGAKVSEQLLADTLKISRSPVREALALLQIEGLVRVYPKRGTFVFSPDEKMVRDLCEHRSVLEAACIEMAITREYDALLEGLLDATARMKHAFEKKDAAAYSEGDIRFHRAIVTSSKNTSIIKVYNSTIGPLMALRTHLFTISNISPERSMTEHAQIIEACVAKDVQSAQRILDQHIQHLDEHYRTTLVKGAA